MIIYLICLLVIGLIIAWNIKKAPSDKDLWGEEEQEKKNKEKRIPPFIFMKCVYINFLAHWNSFNAQIVFFHPCTFLKLLPANNRTSHIRFFFQRLRQTVSIPFHRSVWP